MTNITQLAAEYAATLESVCEHGATSQQMATVFEAGMYAALAVVSRELSEAYEAVPIYVDEQPLSAAVRGLATAYERERAGREAAERELAGIDGGCGSRKRQGATMTTNATKPNRARLDSSMPVVCEACEGRGTVAVEDPERPWDWWHAKCSTCVGFGRVASSALDSCAAGTTQVCKVRAAGMTDPPQDCDWPFCGCDPHASKVLAHLQESGLFLTTVDPASGAGPEERCTGRYPVTHGPRSEPFEVTYRCGLSAGHDGPHRDEP